jgi:hypothetical protein
MVFRPFDPLSQPPVCCCRHTPCNAQLARDQAPRLVLQITVDQLRGDMPASVIDRCGHVGFRYLYGSGMVYANAHRRHANTETVVGHATLATGADPAGTA